MPTKNLPVLQFYNQCTERFAQDILGLPIPEKPERLSPERKKWTATALVEELDEFIGARTLEDEADALIDLMYFASGRIVEMGLAPKALFEEVHEANMRKQRGELSKRPNSKGFDAIKPKGWKGPDLVPYLDISRTELLSKYWLGDKGLQPQSIFRSETTHTIGEVSETEVVQTTIFPPAPDTKVVPTTIFPPAPNINLTPLFDAVANRPKILVMGYARHGKDTVAEMLAKKFDLSFQSSSMFCAEKVILPAMNAGGTFYSDAKECFEDRHNHRSEWYDLICEHNSPDPSRLGRELFAEYDIYAGIRSSTEFHALRNTGTYDVALWVDRSHHLPPEDKSSCTVEPWMADYIVDNNGNLDDLAFNIDQLFNGVLHYVN